MKTEYKVRDILLRMFDLYIPHHADTHNKISIIWEQNVCVINSTLTALFSIPEFTELVARNRFKNDLIRLVDDVRLLCLRQPEATIVTGWDIRKHNDFVNQLMHLHNERVILVNDSEITTAGVGFADTSIPEHIILRILYELDSERTAYLFGHQTPYHQLCEVCGDNGSDCQCASDIDNWSNINGKYITVKDKFKGRE